MNRKLESHVVVVAPVAGLLALSMALLALLLLLPGRAEAQEEEEAVAAPTPQETDHRPTGRLVVEPGDSLWSIVQGRLGPNASPRQVATEVDMLYGLNRNTIGDDPDLIFPGQEFSLPPVGEPAAAAEPATTSKPARAADATPESADRQTPEPAADERAAEPASPPASSGTQATPTPSSEAVQPSSPSPNANEHWISVLGRAHWVLGSGILFLAAVLTLFLAWKAYGVRRSLKRGPKRRYAPSMEIGDPEGEQQRFPLLRAPGLERGPGDLEDTPPAEKKESVLENGARDRVGAPVADYARHKKARRMRTSDPASLRSEAAARVYSPAVRRHLRRPFGNETAQGPRGGGRRWR